MPNFNEVTRKEDIVLDNIRRSIGRFKARSSQEECVAEKEASAKVVRLLEATIHPIYEAIEDGYHLRRNVRGVLQEVREWFVFMEEIAECDVERSLYEEAINFLDITLEDYLEPKKEFCKMWVVCEVASVHSGRLK